MTIDQLNAECAALRPHMTDRRAQLIESVIDSRTRYLTIVLEDIYQSHNASATLRSADAVGLCDVHVIENRYPFSPSALVARGSMKWVDVHQYHPPEGGDTRRCVKTLRDRGYTLAATLLADGTYTPETVPLDRPLALFFGTEMTGLTPEAVSLCDIAVGIPMRGFTQSLNISVSAAVLLYTLGERLRRENHPWPLDTEERVRLRHSYYRRSVRRAEDILDHLRNGRGNQNETPQNADIDKEKNT